ncbi:MAG: hypothetical protein WBB82_09510 [Limnothrix sp.]
MSAFTKWFLGTVGSGLILGLTTTAGQQAAIAQSCVAQTSCGAGPIQVVPGKWIKFEVVNRTGNIINLEQPNATEPIALSPGQTVTLEGSTTDNVSLLFWDIQGLSVQAKIKKLMSDRLRVELVWGNGFGNYSLYLKDDGRVELL